MPGKRKPIEFVVDENGCHICTSHKHVWFGGKVISVHKYIYRTQLGEIPEGKIVAHKCGNKKCINPEHLTLVTREELTAQLAKTYNSKPKPIDFVIDPVTGCFNCTSHTKNTKKYHKIKVDGKFYSIHRFVYEQMFGEIPEGYLVRHKCDNTHCINPEHLEVGTPGDNMRDKVERGRQPRGSNHGRSKLTEEDVREIKKRLAAGDACRYLARIYGVSKTVIQHIKSGKLWKHVTID